MTEPSFQIAADHEAVVDLDLVAESRRNGRVLPFLHWGESAESGLAEESQL